MPSSSGTTVAGSAKRAILVAKPFQEAPSMDLSLS